MKRFFLFAPIFVILSISFASVVNAKIESIDTPTQTNLTFTPADAAYSVGITFDGKYMMGYQDHDNRKVWSLETGFEVNPFVTDDELPLVESIFTFRYFTDELDNPMFMFSAEVTGVEVDPTVGSQTGDFIYIRDITAGTTRLLRDASGDPFIVDDSHFGISRDGRRLVFDSLDQIDTVNDQHLGLNAYLYDFDEDEYSLVGLESSPITYITTMFIDKHPFADNFSADGKFISYFTSGVNLGLSWYDFDNKIEKTIYSIDQSLGSDGDGSEVSASGNKVVFWTEASLLPEDTDAIHDVYIYDPETESLELIGQDPNSTEILPLPFAMPLGFSDDGEVLFFSLYTIATERLEAFFYDIKSKEYVEGFKTESGEEPNGSEMIIGFDENKNYYVSSISTNVLAGQTTSTGCSSFNGVCMSFFTSKINFAADNSDSTPTTSPDVEDESANITPPTLPDTGRHSGINLLVSVMNLLFGGVLVAMYGRKHFL